MRIRKNAMLSSLHNPSIEEHLLQPLVCQLNQSPWDVISLLPSSLCSLHQFEREASPTGTWSSLNCPAQSLESTLAVDEKAVIVEGEEKEEINVKKKITVNKKKKKKQGDRNGDYQLVKCSSTVIESNDNAVRSKGSNRRVRKRTASSSPYEFYYYSGFGPSWGKRRGVEISCAKESKDEGQYRILHAASDSKSFPTGQTTTSSELGQTIYEDSTLDVFYEEKIDFDNEDEDEEEDDDVAECDGRERRIRKPVKARSLRSLM